MSDEIPDRRRAFGDALRGALAASGITQDDLAERMTADGHPVRQTAISQWITGRSEPDTPEVTFRVERALNVRPGSLSRHLGYLPVDAVRTITDLERAIDSDPRLSDLDRDALRLSLRAALQRRGGRGRPPKK